MLTAKIVALAACVGAAAARVTMEPDAVPGVAPSWEVQEACNSNHTIKSVFMLKLDPSKRALLEETFWAVSDPANKKYGKHLTQTEITAKFGNPEAAKTVVAWLSAEGVPKRDIRVTATQDMIEVDLAAPLAERLLETKFHVFKHRTRAVNLNRAVARYSLPNHIADVVALVGDIIALPSMPSWVTAKPADSQVGSAADWPADCKTCGNLLQKFVTPAVLTQRYNLGAAPVKGATKGSMAVAEYQGVNWDQADLNKWAENCGLSTNVTVDVMVGRDSPIECRIPILGAQACAEAMLDIEYIKAVGGGIPLTDIFNSAYSLLKWMTQVSNLANPPLVHSVSYGNDEKQQTSKAYMESCNTQFLKAGAKGLSVLFASGDQGVWGRSGTLGGKFHPDFPAGSPYVTAVGGTDFKTTGVIGDETAWNDGGGGFSDTFAAPSYQLSAVATYKQVAGSLLPTQTMWNATGRGYPDVAALAGVKNPYCVRVGGTSNGIGGTSAATPVVAGVFAKLNELRLSAGKAPLGFLNLFLYKNPSAFFDVTSGRNQGSGKAGFVAVKGWDAATGLGTPNFDALSKLM